MKHYTNFDSFYTYVFVVTLILIIVKIFVQQKGLTFDELKKQIGEGNMPIAQVKEVSVEWSLSAQLTTTD